MPWYLVGLLESDVAYVPSSGAVRVLRSLILLVCMWVCAAVQVRKLHNDRREPGWSFTMLYLVKDSAALMLEGAGLW
jgi:uncharacterized membrane protein YhaH (DUF805 family)